MVQKRIQIKDSLEIKKPRLRMWECYRRDIMMMIPCSPTCICAFRSHPESYLLALKDLRKMFCSPVLGWPIKNHVTEDCRLL